MMRASARRFARVAGVGDRCHDAAASDLRRRRSALDRHQATLEQLTRYKQDYLLRLESRRDDHIKSSEFINLQRFIHNIDEALTVVRAEIREATEACDRQLQTWIGTRSRAKAVQGIIARHRAEERRRVERREQLEVDDRYGIGVEGEE